jgi:hypothetical protein
MRSGEPAGSGVLPARGVTRGKVPGRSLVPAARGVTSGVSALGVDMVSGDASRPIAPGVLAGVSPRRRNSVGAFGLTSGDPGRSPGARSGPRGMLSEVFGTAGVRVSPSGAAWSGLRAGRSRSCTGAASVCPGLTNWSAGRRSVCGLASRCWRGSRPSGVGFSAGVPLSIRLTTSGRCPWGGDAGGWAHEITPMAANTDTSVQFRIISL